MENEKVENGTTSLLKKQPGGADYGSTKDIGSGGYGSTGDSDSSHGNPTKPVDGPERGVLKWCLDLESHFGYKILTVVFSAQHVMKGFVYYLTAAAQPYVYAHYNVSAVQMQIYSGVTFLPWSLKPILGLMTDMLPVGGYNKAPYFMGASVLGSAGLLSVGLSPVGSLSTTLLVVCFFFLSLQISTVDLLSEAKYSAKLQEYPQYGPDLLSYVWFGLTLAGLFASAISGVVILDLGAEWAYLICGIPAALVIMPAALGFLEEQFQTREDVQATRRRFLFHQPEACFLCLLMFVGDAVVLAVGLCFSSAAVNCAVSVTVLFLLLTAFSLLLTPVIAKFAVYTMLQASLTWSISGASYYFYTDDAETYPEGPHFSAMFYNSVLGTMGTLLSLLGIVTYNRYLSHWSYRSLLVVANLAVFFFSQLDVMMFARLNIEYGISDYALVLGASCIESVIANWQWMPLVVILSFLCPKGMESTLYALLAGCHNFGSTVGSNCGAVLLEALGVSPSGAVGESEQFENLWIAAMVVSVLPLISTALLFVLVPDATQSEMLVGDSATEGSLLRRWISPPRQAPAAAGA